MRPTASAHQILARDDTSPEESHEAPQAHTHNNAQLEFSCDARRSDRVWILVSSSPSAPYVPAYMKTYLMYIGLCWTLPAMFQKTDRGAPLHACLRGGQRTPIADGECE